MKNIFNSIAESSNSSGMHASTSKNIKIKKVKVHRILVFGTSQKEKIDLECQYLRSLLVGFKGKKLAKRFSIKVESEEYPEETATQKKFNKKLSENDLFLNSYHKAVNHFNISDDDLNIGISPDLISLYKYFDRYQVVYLLFKCINFNRICVCEYLTDKKRFNMLRLYIQIAFDEFNIEEGSEFYHYFMHFFRFFRTPKDGNKVSDLVKVFSEEFVKRYDVEGDPEKYYFFGTSIFMLNSDLNNAAGKSTGFDKTFLVENVKQGFDEKFLKRVVKNIQKRKPLNNFVELSNVLNIWENIVVYHQKKYFELCFLREKSYSKLVKGFEDHFSMINNSKFFLFTTVRMKNKLLEKSQNKYLKLFVDMMIEKYGKSDELNKNMLIVQIWRRKKKDKVGFFFEKYSSSVNCVDLLSGKAKDFLFLSNFDEEKKLRKNIRCRNILPDVSQTPTQFPKSDSQIKLDFLATPTITPSTPIPSPTFEEIETEDDVEEKKDLELKSEGENEDNTSENYGEVEIESSEVVEDKYGSFGEPF